MSEPVLDLLDWIETGTVGRREVTIHHDPALAAEFDRLNAERDILLKAASDPEASLGDGAGIGEIDAKIEAVYERWQASKSVWTIRALDIETVREVLAGVDFPVAPPHDDKESAEQRQAALREYAIREQRANDERDIQLVARAVEQVETPKGTVLGATVEQIRALYTRPHGVANLRRLAKPMHELTSGEVEIPAPKSLTQPRSSRG